MAKKSTSSNKKKDVGATELNTAVQLSLDESLQTPSATKESHTPPFGTEVNPLLEKEGERGSLDTTEENPLLGQAPSPREERPYLAEAETEPNADLPDAGKGRLVVGEILFGKYTVEKWFRASGEADIYLCSAEDGNLYVAKHYARPEGLKPAVLEALKKIDSPYIMPIYDYGVYKETALEVTRLYLSGSLQDRLDQGERFSFERIKEEILPSLNQALHLLHSAGIVHRDIKPANVMLLPKGEGVALIDFGISTYIEENESITIEDRGRTPIYVAPEQAEPTFLCYSGSDYYSVGIMLYALFCGQPPSAGCQTLADVLRDRLSNGIVFPDDMSASFRKLVYSLTYQDISRRTDPDETRRRWGYREVERFLAGEPVRASGSSARDYTDAIKPYVFAGKEHTTLSALVNALGENWVLAIEELKASRLSHFFTYVDVYPKLADICKQEEENFFKSPVGGDLVLWALLCRLNPRSDVFFWQGNCYNSYSAMGMDMLDKLTRGDEGDYDKWDAILNQGLLSAFLTLKVNEKKGKEADAVVALRDRLLALESDHREKLDGEHGRECRFYETAYILSNSPFRVAVKEGKKTAYEEFDSVEGLAQHLKHLNEIGFSALSGFCRQLFDKKNQLRPSFEAWLLVKGKRDHLAEYFGKGKKNPQ